MLQHVYADNTLPRSSSAPKHILESEERGFRQINLRFRMVVRIDAGISQVLALDEEIVVATKKPAAVQCVRWASEKGTKQTNTELLGRMSWIRRNSNVTHMVFDRAMNIALWLTDVGDAYAVQRLPTAPKDSPDMKSPQTLFKGYAFHTSTSSEYQAIKAAINARFSLLAVGCANGDIRIYTAKDYVGNIPLSHVHSASESIAESGQITRMSYTPDGYCLFVGYENGWATWSVYGKPGANSFGAGIPSGVITQGWLGSIVDSSWLAGGSELLLLHESDDQIYVLEMAKSAATTCLASANIAFPLLLTSTEVMVLQDQEEETHKPITLDGLPWRHIQIPSAYLENQRPIRSVVISPNGRYLAVAGKRGLAHYSFSSGRWRVFNNAQAESEFVIRGGMCWYQHILIASVETEKYHEV